MISEGSEWLEKQYFWLREYSKSVWPSASHMIYESPEVPTAEDNENILCDW